MTMAQVPQMFPHGLQPMHPSQPMTSGPSYTSDGYPIPHSSGGPETPMSPSQNPSQHEQERSGSNSTRGNYELSTQMGPILGTDFGLGFNQPRRTTSVEYPLYMDSQGLPQSLPSLTIPDNNVPGLLAPNEVSPWPSSASDSNFSTPDDASQGRGMIRNYNSPTSDWNGTGGMLPSYQSGTSQELRSPGSSFEAIPTTSSPYILSNTYSPSPQHYGPMVDVPMAFQDDHVAILDHAHHHQAYSPVRSLSPPTVLASAQTTENLVTASISLPSTPPMVGRLKGAALIGPLSGAAASLTAFGLPRPVRNVIPEYLDLYWKRCDTLLPLVHRRGAGSTGELLRCAMGAMATQFLPGKEDRIRGNQLHEFAWHEVKRVSPDCRQIGHDENPDPHPPPFLFTTPSTTHGQCEPVR